MKLIFEENHKPILVDNNYKVHKVLSSHVKYNVPAGDGFLTTGYQIHCEDMDIVLDKNSYGEYYRVYDRDK